PHECRGGPQLADRNDGALADAVGDDSPEKQRRERADVERGEYDANLSQAECVAILDRGSDRRKAKQNRGERRLREDTRAEERPTVVTRLRGRGAHDACGYRRLSGLSCLLRALPRGPEEL